MAANMEQPTTRAQTLEALIDQRVEQGASSPDLAGLLQEYRAACESVILGDFEYAAAKGIETKLWQAHLKVNAIYRKELRHLKRNPKDRAVEIRKLGKQYLAFVKASQRFYRQFVMLLDAQTDGIPELRKIALKLKLKDDASTAPPRKRIPDHLKTQVLQSCHQTLIQLGDLSRYRESELVEKDHNWGPAKGYYDLAAELYPDSGISHNQLAVISREDGDHFRSTYNLYRSLASKYPHPNAAENLALEFKKIVTAWNRGELINNRTSPDGSNAGRALVAWFVRLHSKCFKGEEFAQHDELESEVLGHLKIELKERSLDSILHKIILINLAAEYFATEQMQSAKPPKNILQTYFYYLRLNVKTFFTLLQILQAELERLSDGDDVTQNGDRLPELSDKITAVARRVLPGLRLYSTWFSRYWAVLQAQLATTLTPVEVQELWKAYAATLTLLASSFPAEQLPSDKYMLEEDADTIGFQPLVHPSTMKLWYDGTAMKVKWSDLGERNHPNIEMLMRVRDLLVDGLHLTQEPQAPLDLDGLRFIYREAGLPSELPASPKTDAIVSPSTTAEFMELPSYPPETPVVEDQKAYSVAPPSEASTTLAKDFAMNQMVDDLVGPDELLDPLPEEDENIPPTPPEQTFEDTMVTDTGFYPKSFNINDLVNSVQNYKKPAGTPAPVTTLHAPPMERISSGSSIRQAAHLPSLPDGQYNGDFIWSRNYGTPAPSSPMHANGHDMRVSPLNGMIPPGFSGHVRGDSSNSLRSSGWNAPQSNLSPGPNAPGPVSSGTGNGTVWGNPAASAYSSIYGNSSYANGNYGNGSYGNYGNNNPAMNMTELNMASPLLFGKSSWNPDLDAMHSSYGRTPPNGQGG